MTNLKELIKRVKDLNHNLLVVKNSAGIIALGSELDGIKQTVKAFDGYKVFLEDHLGENKDWIKLKGLLNI